MTARQLALPFEHAAHFDEAFLPCAANQPALVWTARVAAWPDGRLALWGEAGSGKTHLLHAWARCHGATLLDGANLRGDAFGLPALAPRPAPSLASRDPWHPDPDRIRLPDFTFLRPPSTAPLAIDDADLAGEEPLLHLINAAAEAGRPVLLAARAAPARWDTRLPDLRSRLRAVTAVELGLPDDALLRALLARLLADRQLAVAESTQDWLLARLPRTAGALREAAARLDHASLAAGRGVTRTLAASILPDLPGDAPGQTPGPVLL